MPDYTQNFVSAQADNPTGFGPIKPNKSKRLLLGFFIFDLLLVGVFFGWQPFFDHFYPKAITGELVDMVYVPNQNGGVIWFQTDASFYYTSKVTTNTSMSISTESLFNKLYTYTYDPVQKKVLSRTKTEYGATPPHAKMYHIKGQLWMVLASTDDQPAVIDVYDPTTKQRVLDTAGFVSKYPDLKPGISKLSMEEDPLRFALTTKDGKKFTYLLEEDRLILSEEYSKMLYDPSDKKEISLFQLDGVDDDRQHLYYITGPKSTISSHELSNLDKPDSWETGTKAVKLTPEQVYLAAIILYQDERLAVVLSQNQIDVNAERLLTAVNKEGKLLWTLSQSELFPEIALRSDDAFSDLFFMKGKFHSAQQGNLFIFKMDGIGMIGIDAATGKKQWTFRPG